MQERQSATSAPKPSNDYVLPINAIQAGCNVDNGIIQPHALHVHILKYLSPTMLGRVARVSRILNHYANSASVWRVAMSRMSYFTEADLKMLTSPEQAERLTELDHRFIEHFKKVAPNNPAKGIYWLIEYISRKIPTERLLQSTYFKSRVSRFLCFLTPKLYSRLFGWRNKTFLGSDLVNDYLFVMRVFQCEPFVQAYAKRRSGLSSFTRAAYEHPEFARLFMDHPLCKEELRKLDDPRLPSGDHYEYLESRFFPEQFSQSSPS